EGLGLGFGVALRLGEGEGAFVGFGVGLAVGFGVGAGAGGGAAQRGAACAGPAATLVGGSAANVLAGLVPTGGKSRPPSARIPARSGTWIEPRTSKPVWTRGALMTVL